MNYYYLLESGNGNVICQGFVTIALLNLARRDSHLYAFSQGLEFNMHNS